MLAQGVSPGFCQDVQAGLCATRGDLDGALEHSRQALLQGGAEAETLARVAKALEDGERAEEAEELLQMLPAGGCCGGAHPLLAELWLRQGRNLDQALESFKDALRQAPDNPRWLLRIAQVYWEKGWRRDAVPLLEQLLASPDLDKGVVAQAKALLQTENPA